MLRPMIASAFILLTLAGCAIYHVDAQGGSPSSYYPPKDSANDIEYIEHVSRPHEVVGTVLVNAERGQTFEEIVYRMKKEAAFLGGDAITDIRSNATDPWKRLPGQRIIGNGYLRANFTASVIVFK